MSVSECVSVCTCAMRVVSSDLCEVSSLDLSYCDCLLAEPWPSTPAALHCGAFLSPASWGSVPAAHPGPPGSHPHLLNRWDTDRTAPSSVLSSRLIAQAQLSVQEGGRRKSTANKPEFSEGARLLAAAGTVPTTHHALVKLLFGANDAVTAGMNAAALDTDRGAVRGAGGPVYHLRTRRGNAEGCSQVGRGW